MELWSGLNQRTQVLQVLLPVSVYFLGTNVEGRGDFAPILRDDRIILADDIGLFEGLDNLLGRAGLPADAGEPGGRYGGE